jgi:hypothetical protein
MTRSPLVVFALLTLAAAATPQQPVPTQPGQARPADPALAPVPTDSFLFASVKVSKLWDNQAGKPLRDWLATQKPNPFDAVVGLDPAEIDRVTLFVPAADRRPGEPLVLVTTRRPYNEAKVLKGLGVGKGDDRRGRLVGRTAEINGGPFRWVVFVDDRTILYLAERFEEGSGPNLIGQLIARKADGPLAAALIAAQTHDITLALDVQALATVLGDGPRQLPPELAPYLALLKAKTATVTVDFEKTAAGRLTLAFPDAATARRAGPVLEEGIKTITELLTAEVKREGRADPIPKLMAEQALVVLKAAKVTATGNDVVAAADVPYADQVAKLVTVLPKQLALARNTAAARNNLKQLALGLHNMESAYGQFPGDVGFFAGEKNPPISWRVSILPFIEQDNLYKQLNPNMPWDDPANLKVLEATPMPKIFEVPGRPAPKGHTYFRIFSFPKNAKGTDKPFFVEGERGPKFADITDGTSNTFMIVEAGEAVPWYKPDVLAYDGKLPLPQLGDKETGTFLVAMGDGSVRELRTAKLNEQTLRALITRSGGEVIPNLDR